MSNLNNRTGLTLLTAPTFEPLTLQTLKNHLRIQHSLEDTHLRDVIIPGVRAAVERYTRRALVKQKWKMTLSEFPGYIEPIELPTPPLQTVDEFAYYDAGGVKRTLLAQQYQLEKDDEGARLHPVVGGSWPDTQAWRSAAVEVSFTCGYMDTSAADGKLPPDIRSALLLWAAHMYENREPVVVGSIASSMPLGVEDLLGPLRAVRF